MAANRCACGASACRATPRIWLARLRRRCWAAAPNACFDRRGTAPGERPLTPPEHADSSPLAGRRIVVTRAPEQSQELLDRLRDAGADALSLPMVRFVEL